MRDKNRDGANRDKKRVEWEGKRKVGVEEGRERKRQSLLNNAVHMLI